MINGQEKGFLWKNYCRDSTKKIKKTCLHYLHCGSSINRGLLTDKNNPAGRKPSSKK